MRLCWVQCGVQNRLQADVSRYCRGPTVKTWAHVGRNINVGGMFLVNYYIILYYIILYYIILYYIILYYIILYITVLIPYSSDFYATSGRINLRTGGGIGLNIERL